MKCRDLFRNSDVIYVPVEDDLQKQENQITTYASYHGIRVRMELGLWVNPATQECERVLKVSYVEDCERKVKQDSKRTEIAKQKLEKIERIRNYLKQGLNGIDIARLEGCSKQYIYQFIKDYHITAR